MRITKIAALFALGLTTGLSGCAFGPSSQVVGEIERVEGTVSVIRNAEEHEVMSQDPVRTSDIILVGDDSIGRLVLDGGGEIELRGSRIQVRADGTVELMDGTILVTGTDGLQVQAAGIASQVGSGNVRFDLRDELRVGAYEADALEIDVSDDMLALPSYWQVVVAEEGRVAEGGPLQFSAQDSIDRRMLAEALRIDSRLANLLRGLEAQIQAAAGSPVVAHLVDEGIDPGVVASFPASPRSDLLVGLALARQRSDSLPQNIDERFAQLLLLRRLGATWGLLTQQYGLDGDLFLATIQEEVVAVLFPPNDDVPRGRELVPRPAAPSPAASPAPAPTPADTPAPGPGGTPTPGQSPAPVLDPLRPLLPDEVESIVDELFGLVDDLVPLL